MGSGTPSVSATELSRNHDPFSGECATLSPPSTSQPDTPCAESYCSRLGYVSWSRASLQCRHFWLIAHPSCLEAHPSCLEALKMKCACAAPTLSASVPSDLAAEDTHTTYHQGFHHPRPGFLQVQPEPLACAHRVLRRPFRQARRLHLVFQ